MIAETGIRGLSSFDEGYYEYYQWTWLNWIKFFLRILIDVVVPLRLWPFGPKRVLDLGCGKGEMVLILRLLSIKVYGLDISPAAAKHWGRLRRRCCIMGDCLAPPFTRMFNVVISQDLLEHLYPWEVPQALVAASSLCKSRMLHMVTTSEDVPLIDLDATHRTKRSSEWWRRIFDLFEWEVAAPTRRRRRAGYYLLLKRPE